MEVFSYILVGATGLLIGAFLAVIVDVIRIHKEKKEQQKLLKEETNKKMLEFIENYNKDKEKTNIQKKK